MKKRMMFLLLILAVSLITLMVNILLPKASPEQVVENQALSKSDGNNRQETAAAAAQQTVKPLQTEDIQALTELTELIQAKLKAKAEAKAQAVLPIPDDQPVIEEEKKQLAKSLPKAVVSQEKTGQKNDYQDALEIDLDQQLVLKKLDQEYGIPAEVMVSLWHQESLQGKLLGKYRTTATLGKRELEHFKEICRETNRKVNQPCSKKGALGHFQFMPSTWTAYAEDFNGDGKADPFSFADSAATAAKYLSEKGFEEDPEGALAAYLGGNLNSKSTREYVARVLTRAELYVTANRDQG